MEDMENTLVERHPAPDGKNQNGDDQGPEVYLLSMSERMVFVGRPSAHAKPEQKERAVTGIDKRMDSLRQHRGTSCYDTGKEFDRRDTEISGNSRNHRCFGFGHDTMAIVDYGSL
jgi:hypothetical protein